MKFIEQQHENELYDYWKLHYAKKMSFGEYKAELKYQVECRKRSKEDIIQDAENILQSLKTS